jgi:hypothetical protein
MECFEQAEWLENLSPTPPTYLKDQPPGFINSNKKKKMPARCY